MTFLELTQILGAENAVSYSGRFAELKELGVIEEVGEKINAKSNKTALLWDVTAELPRKVEKKIVPKMVVLFPTGQDESPKLFKNISQAKQYKLKTQTFGSISEVDDLRRWDFEKQES